jgi:hypothetical protein
MLAVLTWHDHLTLSLSLSFAATSPHVHFQAQSIRLHRQDKLLRGPIAQCMLELQTALRAGGVTSLPFGPNLMWPALHSVALSGQRFVDAREFQRHYREHLDAALSACKVSTVVSDDRIVSALSSLLASYVHPSASASVSVCRCLCLSLSLSPCHCPCLLYKAPTRLLWYCTQVKVVDLDVVSNPFATSAALGHWLPVPTHAQARLQAGVTESKAVEGVDDDRGGASDDPASTLLRDELALGSACVCRVRGHEDGSAPVGEHGLVEVG